MSRYFTFLLFLVLLSAMLPAQTRTDSICGTYFRHTWEGVGWTNLDLGNGTTAEIAGYTISTSDETLLLEKNHCAALTVNTQPGNYGFALFTSNPVVYYGIWKMSGDTLSITFSKSLSTSLFFLVNDSTTSYTTKLDPVMQRNYVFEMNGLTSLTNGDHVNYQFYKEEDKDLIKE